MWHWGSSRNRIWGLNPSFNLSSRVSGERALLGSIAEGSRDQLCSLSAWDSASHHDFSLLGLKERRPATWDNFVFYPHSIPDFIKRTNVPWNKHFLCFVSTSGWYRDRPPASQRMQLPRSCSEASFCHSALWFDAQFLELGLQPCSLLLSAINNQNPTWVFIFF